jgi:hypothetical protein
MSRKLAYFLSSLLCAAAALSANEIVVLKGGKTMELAKPYVLRGSQAVMTLKDGTVVSVAAADIDLPATRAARRPARVAPEAPVAATTPVEAAKAQQHNPKARVKIGDADVSHTIEGAETEEAAPAEGTPEEAGGDAKLEVVDFDQRPSGSAVAVKGTLRNSGKAPASNVALSIAAMDDTGKVVASAMASVSAGSLDAGAAATFTASLPMTAKAATLRFTPRWSSAAPAASPSAPGSAAGFPATAVAPTPAGAAKPAPPSPATEKKQPEYKPQPDYAPPPANAPMEPTGDVHTGYIPGAHEETPPPPPQN